MSSITSQADFATALLRPRQAAPAGLMAANDQEAAHRFAVHRNNVVVSLVDALVESFPVCQALVGDDFFRAMARERVLADPPRSPLLFEYADGFAEFIAGFAPPPSVPYLADVARIEAWCVRAWHAADAEPAAEAAYRELAKAPERLAMTRARLHPACGWLRSKHPAHAIWSAHQGLPDPSQASLQDIDMSAAQDILVVRALLQVEVVDLPGGAFALLEALAQGESIGHAFTTARAVQPEVDPGALFAMLMRHGLVVAFESVTEH